MALFFIDEILDPGPAFRWQAKYLLAEISELGAIVEYVLILLVIVTSDARKIVLVQVDRIFLAHAPEFDFIVFAVDLFFSRFSDCSFLFVNDLGDSVFLAELIQGSRDRR